MPASTTTALSTSGQFNSPTGLALDASGNLYVADAGAHQVKKLDTTGHVTVVAGSGVYGDSGDGGLALNAAFNDPWGVALDANNNLYIADRTNNEIRKVSLTSGLVTQFAGNGTIGYNGDGEVASQALVYGPQALLTNAAGTVLYIADRGNQRVRKVDLTTNIISTIAGGGTGTAENVSALSVSVVADAMTFDAAGNLYVIDHNFDTLRKVTIATGLIATIAGNGSYVASGNCGQALQAGISDPFNLAVNASGVLFFGDAGYPGSGGLRRVDQSTKIISVFGSGLDGGNQMIIDGSGNLYVAGAKFVWKVTGAS